MSRKKSKAPLRLAPKPLKVIDGSLVAVLRPLDQSAALKRLQAIGSMGSDLRPDERSALQLQACDKMLEELAHTFIGLLADSAGFAMVCDYNGAFLCPGQRGDSYINHARFQALNANSVRIGTVSAPREVAEVEVAAPVEEAAAEEPEVVEEPPAPVEPPEPAPEAKPRKPRAKKAVAP